MDLTLERSPPGEIWPHSTNEWPRFGRDRTSIHDEALPTLTAPAQPGIVAWIMTVTRDTRTQKPLIDARDGLHSVLQESLKVARTATAASRCALIVRHEAGDEATMITSDCSVVPELNGFWIDAMEASRDTHVLVELSDGSCLRPLPIPGHHAAALVIEGAAELPGVAHAVESVAHQISAILEMHVRWSLEQPALSALIEIGTEIQAEETSLDGVLRMVVDKARQLIGADISWLATADDQGERIRLRVASGVRTAQFLSIAVDIGAGIGGAVIGQARTVFVPRYTDYGNSTPDWVRDILAAEGVSSVLCAPVAAGQQIMGALYVASREPTRFSANSGALLTALGGQAAAAIVNAQLYEQLADRNRALERNVDVHQRLTQASLAGAGLQIIVDEIGKMIGTGVGLLADSATPSTIFSSNAHPDQALSTMGTPPDEAVPIIAGAQKLGHLFVLEHSTVSSADHRVLEHGATVIALEIVKQQAADDVEWRLRGELLNELLACPGAISPPVAQQAARFGFELDRCRQLAVVAAVVADKGPGLIEYIKNSVARQSAANDLLVSRRGSSVVLALAADADAPSPIDIVRKIQTHADHMGIATCAGISGSAPPASLNLGLRQAEACLRLARNGKVPVLVEYSTLGPLRFMLDSPQTSEMSALVTEQLAELAAYERRDGNAPLVETLRAFLYAGGHQTNAADACYIHVSTLKYRLARISELVGCSLADPQVRFRLMLAFEVRDVLQHVGEDPLS